MSASGAAAALCLAILTGRVSVAASATMRETDSSVGVDTICVGVSSGTVCVHVSRGCASGKRSAWDRPEQEAGYCGDVGVSSAGSWSPASSSRQHSRAVWEVGVDHEMMSAQVRYASGCFASRQPEPT